MHIFILTSSKNVYNTRCPKALADDPYSYFSNVDHNMLMFPCTILMKFPCSTSQHFLNPLNYVSYSLLHHATLLIAKFDTALYRNLETALELLSVTVTITIHIGTFGSAHSLAQWAPRSARCHANDQILLNQTCH